METVNWSDWLIYDETSPSCLRWKVDRRYGFGGCHVNALAGDSAGTIHPKGYWHVGLLRMVYRCHRIIMEMHGTTLVKGDCIDHVDGDRNNNNISNLRIVTNQSNCRNRGITKKNKSGVVGVYMRTYGWDSKQAWTAFWKNLSGENQSKTFTVGRFGYDEAFRLACAYRVKMIEELNLAGAGYTERHGIAVAHVKAKDLALEM